MNWYHWHKEISKEADDLSDRMQELAARSELPDAVWLVEENRQRQLIDQICAEYAESKKWPINLTPVQITLIYFRLCQADDHAENMAAGLRPLNQSSAELDSERDAALKYLLVEFWHSEGRKKWLTS